MSVFIYNDVVLFVRETMALLVVKNGDEDFYYLGPIFAMTMKIFLPKMVLKFSTAKFVDHQGKLPTNPQDPFQYPVTSTAIIPPL